MNKLFVGGKKEKPGQGFEQPLPDVVGFKQHVAECGNDSLQEVLMFADGIREFTQPIVYGLTKEQIDLRTRLSLEFDDWRKFQEYFDYAQTRFRAHYDVINYLRTHKISPQKYYDEHDEVCLLNPLFKGKNRVSADVAVKAVKAYKEEKNYSATGLFYSQIKEIISDFLLCFGIPFKQENGINLDGVGIVVMSTSIDIKAGGVEKKKSLGHVVAFLKVLGSWFYYDDNLGFIKVDGPVLDALKAEKLRIVNYKKVYFAKVGNDDIIESLFIDGSWSSDLSVLKTAEGQMQTGAHMYIPTLRNCSSILQELVPEINGAKSDSELVKTMGEFREQIYDNIASNSAIFEKMYSYVYKSMDLVLKNDEMLAFVKLTLPTVVLRPACSPMTHYWCNKIQLRLSGVTADSYKWFNVPQLKSMAVHERVNTPVEFKQKLEEERVKKEERERKRETKKLTPCLPGQRRNAKTMKCVDRPAPKEKEVPEEKEEKEAKEKGPKRSPCPKGEQRVKGDCVPKCEEGEQRIKGECVPRCAEGEQRIKGVCVPRCAEDEVRVKGICVEKCGPGQVRDMKTMKCHSRLPTPCPPGQIRDPKTKECRDQVLYKF